MKNTTLIISFIFGLILMNSCNKQEHWETSISDIKYVSSDKAIVKIIYDFGGKEAKTSLLLRVSTDADFKNDLEVYQLAYAVQNATYNEETVYLNAADQLYYLQSMMVCKEDTVFSEIINLKTLEHYPVNCSVTDGEVYYAEHDITESVGKLVTYDNPEMPDAISYKVATDVGDMQFTFQHEIENKPYVVLKEFTENYSYNPQILIGCWFNESGMSGYYQADELQNVYLSKDKEGNVSLAFCDLKMTKMEGEGEGTLTISGRVSN